MLDGAAFFTGLIGDIKGGKPRSICSVCSSNALVIEAAMEQAMDRGQPVLIETTANQTNQFGGYTGMQPADFADYVCRIADSIGFDRDMLILGGDHLGPLVWRGEAEHPAMEKAAELVSAFAAGGFGKLHLDCSMRLADDEPKAPLSAETVAKRAAVLAAAAEKAAAAKPVYVVGSEVPVPGGAAAGEAASGLTKPEALKEEYLAFHDAFSALGLEEAWARVIGIVAQSGAEFADDRVFLYEQHSAAALTAAAMALPGVALEAHSTDYQPASCLKAMRDDGFAVLKVGPALTFAAREAIFALEEIERELIPSPPEGGYSQFRQTLEAAMLSSPANWLSHYHGREDALHLMRGYSLSDRSRYYMDMPPVKAALERLMRNIDSVKIPIGLLHQYLPMQAEALTAGQIQGSARELIKYNIRLCLRNYG